MKSNAKLISYSFTILFMLGCTSINSFRVREGGAHDTYIDKENEPYLYIDPKPESKYRFINKLGIEKEVKQISSQWIEIQQLKGQFYFHLSYGNVVIYK